MAEPVLPSTARALLARTARAQRDGRAPSLVAGVVRGGELVWSAGRGDVPEPHTDVQYRLGSISKTVTAVAVLRLRDEGRLHLDDPLDRHVPGTPLGDRTVGQLLAHVAGAARAVHPWADVVLPEPEHDAGVMAAAGQLWATLADLGRFAAFLLGDTGDVLDPATLEEMTVPAGVDPSAVGWAAYGLGLQVLRVDGRTLVGHGCSMPGFLAGV